MQWIACPDLIDHAGKAPSPPKQLDEPWRGGELICGLYVTDQVILTCGVMERAIHHRHFVDENRGGYALAARDLKSRQTQRTEDSTRDEGANGG